MVDPDTGRPDCALIYAARIRAKQYAGSKPGYRDVAARAEKMYKSNHCETKIHIQIHDGTEEKLDIDLANLVEILY